MGKLSFLTGAAVGYVLGARAGRNRYEQIRSGAQKLWQNPTVQHRVSDVEGAVRAKAPEVGHKVMDAAGSKIGSGNSSHGAAGTNASDRRTSGDIPPTARGDDGRLHPDISGFTE
ncbi:MAG TPA: YtxH domain-containing protein [Segeticoccus sp.]|uniref:YtxH domain-containing protein n=1 Tax=Segeticoccus sp. TaxID=2706531 RepID=UPI002D7F4B53|nr:YtxH domain-containing protein [Segeticoccus sp.]HET8600602.1 YtxH domain-containing protein [Segeticoccus sp.]